MTQQFELLKGLRGLIRRDRTAFKRDLFFRHLENYRIASVIYRLASKNRILHNLIVELFYLYNYLCITTVDSSGSDARYFTMVELQNEKASLRECLSNETRSQLSCGQNSHKFIRKNLLKVLSQPNYHLRSFLRVRRILKRVAVEQELFVCLRASQYFAYYNRFVQELAPRQLQGSIVFTDNNPHGLALMHASHRLVVSVTFVSHGEPQLPIHPLVCDRAFLLGESSAQKYLSYGSQLGEIIYRGHRDQGILQQTAPIERVGLFLSKLTTAENLLILIDEVEQQLAPKSFLIRAHPSFSSKLIRSAMVMNDGECPVEWSHSGLEEDIERCDCVFAGNSTVHLDVLMHGRPSVYAFALEGKYFDRYGYVKSGLILDWENLKSQGEISLVAGDFFLAPRFSQVLAKHLSMESGHQASIERLNESLA